MTNKENRPKNLHLRIDEDDRAAVRSALQVGPGDRSPLRIRSERENRRIECVVAMWQAHGDMRPEKALHEEAEVWCDTYTDRLNESVDEWIAEGVDRQTAESLADRDATRAAQAALEEFRAD